MLNEVIQNAASAAQAIIRVPPAPGVGEMVRSHAVQFLNHAIPVAGGLRAQVMSYATDSHRRVADLLEGIDRGQSSLILTMSLRVVARGAEAVMGQISTAAEVMSGMRRTVADDHAAVAQQQAQIGAQLQGLSAQRDHWREEAENLRKRSAITTGIGAFIPLVKVADEIASLIQYQKSTEAQLREVEGQFAQVQRQAAMFDAILAQSGTLLGGLDQLGTGVQNLANAMSVLNGRLNSEDHFASVATPETARLFLTALTASLNTLIEEAR